MTITENNLMIEIVCDETGDIIVLDTFAHCIECDDGLAQEADCILAALDCGEFYHLGGGAAAGFVIRPAALDAYTYA